MRKELRTEKFSENKLKMNLSLALFLALFGSILFAASSLAESDCNCNTPGPIANNILYDYVSTEAGVHKIHADRASWNNARNICLDEGAQLVVIESAAEEAMLLRHMKVNNVRSVWIGIHDLFEKKQWTTVTGQRLYSLGFVHWGKGEPNGLGAGERCVEMNKGGMNDLACETESAFVCEKNGIDIRFGNN